MKWSFCICFNATDYVNQQIASIVNQKELVSHNYQIVLIGPSSNTIDVILKENRDLGVDICFISFDDSAENGWITKKKNISTYMAKYDNLVMMHDYVALCENWYSNFVLFGDKWEVCMTPIRSFDGRRFRDWITFKEVWGWPEFLNYNIFDQTKNMYISGTYWCAKKSYMLKNPLNENLRWGQGEDLEWSHRCRMTWDYKMNVASVVKLLKEKRFKGELDHAPHPDTDPNSDNSDIQNSVVQKVKVL